MITLRVRDVKHVRQSHQAASWLARLGSDGFLDPRIVVNRSEGRGYPEGRGSGLDCAVDVWGLGHGVRVEDDGNAGQVRRDFLE